MGNSVRGNPPWPDYNADRSRGGGLAFWRTRLRHGGGSLAAGSGEEAVVYLEHECG